MPIDFSLSDEQKEIRNLVHEFAEREIRPQAAYFDEHEETPWEIMRKAHALGIGPQAAFPEEYGGGGLDVISQLIMQEELSWGDAGIAISIMASGLGGAGIIAMGTEEQKQRYIPELCNPKELKIAAMGLTEPNSGSDSLALETTATKVEEGYVLNGTKQFTTNGGIANYSIIFATTDKSQGPLGITAFVIEKDNPGMKQGRKEKKLGVRASHTAQVILDNCFVGDDARLGFDAEGNMTGPGAVGAMLMLEATRPAIAAGALGIARAAYEFVLEYTQQRHQFGKPLAKHQDVAFKLADMATELEAMRLLTWQAGWMAQKGIRFDKAQGSMAKLYTAERGKQITMDAIQLMGGYGYIKEYPVEKYHRDSIIYSLWEGVSAVQKLVIARAILNTRI